MSTDEHYAAYYAMILTMHARSVYLSWLYHNRPKAYALVVKRHKVEVAEWER
jgi:hypothetical protein